MSIAEIFLLLWAVGATVGCGFFMGVIRHAAREHKHLALLLAEVATGEVTAKDEGNGFISVENNAMKMTFRKIGG